jgi:hypothetical protein
MLVNNINSTYPDSFRFEADHNSSNPALIGKFFESITDVGYWEDIDIRKKLDLAFPVILHNIIQNSANVSLNSSRPQIQDLRRHKFGLMFDVQNKVHSYEGCSSFEGTHIHGTMI